MEKPIKKIMALDYGSKRIGVAASDPLGLTAQGICTIERKNKKKDIAEIVAWAEKLDVGEILMGKPMRMTGTPGTLQEEIERFAVALEKASNRPVTLRDERFTTVQAERHLIDADVSREKRKGVIDKIAAQLLLQSYLDSLPRSGG